MCVGVGERVMERCGQLTQRGRGRGTTARGMFDDFILSPWIDRLLFVGVSFLVRLSGHAVCCHPTFGKQVGATRGIEGSRDMCRRSTCGRLWEAMKGVGSSSPIVC
jgi:hypothetical protein